MSSPLKFFPLAMIVFLGACSGAPGEEEGGEESSNAVSAMATFDGNWTDPMNSAYYGAHKEERNIELSIRNGVCSHAPLRKKKTERCSIFRTRKELFASARRTSSTDPTIESDWKGLNDGQLSSSGPFFRLDDLQPVRDDLGSHMVSSVATMTLEGNELKLKTVAMAELTTNSAGEKVWVFFPGDKRDPPWSLRKL
ncbi:MAG: hypothetical protein NVS3B20_01890 [Polyangiales bacterium]